MPPRRSTLKEKISSSAFLSLEQVKEDLEVLEWSECPLRSIRTLKSAEENLLAADDLQIICASSTSDPCRFLPSPATVESRGSAKRSRSNKMRKTAMKTGADAGDSDSLLLPSSWQSIGLCWNLKQRYARDLEIAFFFAFFLLSCSCSVWHLRPYADIVFSNSYGFLLFFVLVSSLAFRSVGFSSLLLSVTVSF